jgi:hypothetical protein
MPHAKYRYKRFLTHIIPRLAENEARSPLLQYYYVFVSHEHRDLFDRFGRTHSIVSSLQYLSEEYGTPLEDMFETVYVFTSSADAHRMIVDPLLAEGLVDMTTNSRPSKRQIRAERYRLGLLETLSDPKRHMELMRPRQKALAAAASIRDPNQSAAIATAAEENPEARRVIAETARREAQKNRANAAASARANVQKTVRNMHRLPRNVVRNSVASYLLGTPRNITRRFHTSRTANVRPKHLKRLFEKEENAANRD